MGNGNGRVLNGKGIEKVPTGIPSFDFICQGGLPRSRVSLLTGTAGSGKTVFAAQFLARGISEGQTGVFVTFEESPTDIRRNVAGLGWDVEAWEADGQWAFVDASPQRESDQIVVGAFDLGGLLARIEHAVRSIGAQRVVIDSIGALFDRFADKHVIRHELFRIAAALRKLEVTTILTGERENESSSIARFGVEEFVADNVVVFRNSLEAETRRRTVEILKFRGAPHQKGEFPFTIRSDEGVVVIPLSALELTQRSTDLRISLGVPELDELCGGGAFRDSVTLVSGATGTGKTLMAMHFLAAGAEADERSLLFAYEESREQLVRNAIGWGVDLPSMEQDGVAKVIPVYPETMGLEDHLLQIKETIEEFKPTRVAIDSLSALERVSTKKGFREFVIGLTSFIKHHDTAGLVTSTSPTLLGGTSVTEAHISTLTDAIILLRYVEMFGEMRRGLTVLKMRGSPHVKEIREFRIDGSGMHVGEAFRQMSGIIAGNPRHTAEETERIEGLFKD